MIYINNQEKIDRLKLEKTNFYVVADFDRTLTEGDSDSTWGVFANANQVSEEYKERRTALFNKYRPIEIDQTISEEEKSKAMTEQAEERPAEKPACCLFFVCSVARSTHSTTLTSSPV